MSLACWPLVGERAHPSFNRSYFKSWRVACYILFTSEVGGAILDADYPSLRQADMDYNVASSRITPDLTSIILPWYERSFYERLCYQWCMMI